MAIDLIDTIKPKNNGTFPMVEAEDVVVGKGTAEEMRLPAALKKAGPVVGIDTDGWDNPADNRVPSTALVKAALAKVAKVYRNSQTLVTIGTNDVDGTYGSPLLQLQEMSDGQRVRVVLQSNDGLPTSEYYLVKKEAISGQAKLEYDGEKGLSLENQESQGRLFIDFAGSGDDSNKSDMTDEIFIYGTFTTEGGASVFICQGTVLTKRKVVALLAEKADSVHTHSANDITSGTISRMRLPEVNGYGYENRGILGIQQFGGLQISNALVSIWAGDGVYVNADGKLVADMTKLAAKTHTHAMGDVTGLDDELAKKSPKLTAGKNVTLTPQADGTVKIDAEGGEVDWSTLPTNESLVYGETPTGKYWGVSGAFLDYYAQLKGWGGVTVDDAFLDTSENPVQNKVIANWRAGVPTLTWNGENAGFTIPNAAYQLLFRENESQDGVTVAFNMSGDTPLKKAIPLASKAYVDGLVGDISAALAAI